MTELEQLEKRHLELECLRNHLFWEMHAKNIEGINGKFFFVKSEITQAQLRSANRIKEVFDKLVALETEISLLRMEKHTEGWKQIYDKMLNDLKADQ